MLLAQDEPAAGRPAQFRTSSYTIYVDLKEDRQNMLVVHGYTGAFDLVSVGVAAYLHACERTRPPKPLYGEWSDDAPEVGAEIPAASTIERLRKRGFLTTMAVEEEEAFFVKAAGTIQAASRVRMPFYIVMPTYDCNLRCGYCFQDHMRTDAAFSQLLRPMPIATADRIIAALPQFELRHGIGPDNRSTRTFMFFGGEPLLAESLPIVEHFMAEAQSAGPATFAAVTNGTQLDTFTHLLGPGKIDTLQITLDGPPSRHDRRRINADGSGTFEAIARNVTMALELGVRVSLRMNVDRANIGDLPELATIFAGRSWTAFPNFSSYAEPVTDTAFGTPGRRAKLFNSFELNAELARLRGAFPSMAAIGTRDDALAARARQIFGHHERTMEMRASFCGAHSDMYIFDAFGDVYACWERTGDKNIRIGWIDESATAHFVGKQEQNWRERTVVSNPTCRRCRFALYCGGGCAVFAEAVNGQTMHANYCDAFGKRFRSKIAEAYEGHVRGTAPMPAAPPSMECR